MDKIKEILEKYEESKHLWEVLFSSDYNLNKHYNKHVISDEDGQLKMDFMSKDDYNYLADTLSSSHAGKLNNKEATIIGYTTKSGKFIKYDKLNHLLIVYAKDGAIALYKQGNKKFWDTVNGNRNPEYAYDGPLPPEES